MVYLAAVGILHHEAQPVVGLERVLQALQRGGERGGNTRLTAALCVIFNAHYICIYTGIIYELLNMNSLLIYISFHPQWDFKMGSASEHRSGE